MTDDERAFLAAIRAHPSDRTPRLVYADWLEDRGDPRAELVRVCEAMRQVPVFSDEYWRLKARRNELRAGCPADWLAATGYDGSDYDPVFRDGVPDDWKGRWRLIREFTERWHGIPMGDVGGHQSEIRDTEQRLGIALPPSIREYVAYAHDVSPGPGPRCIHRDPYTMEPIPDQQALSLMVISEGNVNWAVRNGDLGRDDPPVYTYYWAENDETRYVPATDVDGPEAETVTDFVLSFTESYKPHSGRFASQVRNPTLLRQHLEAAFSIRRPTRPDCGSYESPRGILASFYPDRHSGSRRVVLSVCVRQGVPWEAVPEFLWEHARRRHMCSGMFFSQADVESGLTHWGNQPVPDWVAREAVPPMREPATPEPPGPGDEDDIPF